MRELIAAGCDASSFVCLPPFVAARWAWARRPVRRGRHLRRSPFAAADRHRLPKRDADNAEGFLSSNNQRSVKRVGTVAIVMMIASFGCVAPVAAWGERPLCVAPIGVGARGVIGAAAAVTTHPSRSRRNGSPVS